MKTTGKNMKSTCAQALLAAALVYAVTFTTTVAQAAAPMRQSSAHMHWALDR